MPETILHIEFLNLLETARRNVHPKTPFHETIAKQFFSLIPDGTSRKETVELKRRAYISLLDDLQLTFMELRYRQNLRISTANFLFFSFLLLLLLAALPFATTYIFSGYGDAGKQTLISKNPIFGFGSVMTFGLLGAFYSRLMRFQQRASTLELDDCLLYFHPSMMAVRLAIGMLGSIVFFFVMRSGLVRGAAFPDFTNLVAVSPSAGESKIVMGETVKTAVTYLGPTEDLAKLMIWSFIAGFSERLVPETLEKTEGRAGTEKSAI